MANELHDSDDTSSFQEMQTLLRLKRYEQPPQGFEAYGERFLKEFHRRQRWESSRKKGFAAWLEKASDWLEAFTVPRYAYATAIAVFGAIALGINGMQPAVSNSPIAATSFAVPSSVSTPRTALALNPKLDLSDLEVHSRMNLGSQPAYSSTNEVQPRYILDTRPASYDASFSF
jgi:hypothetical protein